MLLPGDNYSEQLMFTLEGYRARWVDGRLTQLYGETIAALNEASELSKADLEQLNAIQDDDPMLQKAYETYVLARKAFRFSKAAAPLILADGPLPFGDAVFVLALGLDLGIAAYNWVNDDD